MADFFRSALGYLGNVAGREDNDFVGQNVELGDHKYRVRRVIAEGGSAKNWCVVCLTLTLSEAEGDRLPLHWHWPSVY